MKIVHNQDEMFRLSREFHRQGESIGLVPTMGYFHEGHLALMRKARECADIVVTSLFVNPLQFGENEDLDAYPKALEQDSKLAEKEGVAILFCPDAAEMYQQDFQTKVSVQSLSDGLCGADRPGHFDGVATVVSKLFNIIQPDIAVFGQKDFQQLAIIRQLTKDLSFNVEIIGHPIVREEDGLAMSSRNSYLDNEGRKEATCLYRALTRARQLFAEHGGSLPAATLEDMAREMIGAEPHCVVEYAAVIDKTTLKPIKVTNQDSVLVLAMKVKGRVRLIDNSPLTEN